MNEIKNVHHSEKIHFNNTFETPVTDLNETWCVCSGHGLGSLH